MTKITLLYGKIVSDTCINIKYSVSTIHMYYCYRLDVAPLRGCWLARNTATSAPESPLTLNHTFVKSTDTHTLTTGDSLVDNMAATVEEREEQEYNNARDKENVKTRCVWVGVCVTNRWCVYLLWIIGYAYLQYMYVPPGL